MIWRGLGNSISKNSRIGTDVAYNNKNPRIRSMREVELFVKSNKDCNAMYFMPIHNILEIMARNGKINGIFRNTKQGWHMYDITVEEIKTKHKLEWKVRHETFEEFKNDMELIRDYRFYYASKKVTSDDAVKMLEMMTKEEWTVNDIDGLLNLKQLYIKYKMDTIKVKNLEFRIRDEISIKGVTEIPIVIQDENDCSQNEGHNPTKLKMIENQWQRENKVTFIPSNKRKRQLTPKKVKDKTTAMRIGNEELIKETLEVKKLLLSLNAEKDTKAELVTFDKIDQIREIERSVLDEQTKEMVIQIILSRQDNNELKYKLLEEELLTGKNFTIQMPKVQNIRNNILGMIQVIEEAKTEEWEDENLVHRLQKITGNRMKQIIEHQLKNIVSTLVNFKKEMDIVNDVKEQCEDKNNFDLVKFKDILREMVETKEYENVRFDYLERWCIEIERCIKNGLKPKRNDENDTNVQAKPSTSKAITNGNNYKRGRFDISTDSENDMTMPERIPPIQTDIREKIMDHEKETITISSSTDESKTSIEGEEIEYIEFSSSDEEE